jgi:hypothetical protein
MNQKVRNANIQQLPTLYYDQAFTRSISAFIFFSVYKPKNPKPKRPFLATGVAGDFALPLGTPLFNIYIAIIMK